MLGGSSGGGGGVGAAGTGAAAVVVGVPAGTGEAEDPRAGPPESDAGRGGTTTAGMPICDEVRRGTFV